MRNYISIAEQNEMIGKLVESIGTSGIGDGAVVKGILIQIQPYPIVNVNRGNGYKMPYAVAGQTLKVIPKPKDYLVTIREKYSRLTKTFRVDAIQKRNCTVADLNETNVSYTINNKTFLKKDLMLFSCTLCD